MDEFERRQLAELFAADDRLRNEHERWIAAREAEAAAPVQKSDREDILYREHENSAPADSVATPSADGDDGMFADPELNRTFCDTMAHVICELRREWRDEIRDEIEMERVKHDRALAELRGKNIEVKGLLGDAVAKIARLERQIDTLLSIIGQRAAARSAPEDNALLDWSRRSN